MIRKGTKICVDRTRVSIGKEDIPVGTVVTIDTDQLNGGICSELDPEERYRFKELFTTPCLVEEVAPGSRSCDGCEYSEVCDKFVRQVHEIIPWCGSGQRSDCKEIRFRRLE